MKQRYCDIPQDVLESLLMLPDGARIVRMDVLHDSRLPGPAPLRIVVESDEFGDNFRNCQMTAVSPTYISLRSGYSFAGWWQGSEPVSGKYFDGLGNTEA
jgi:hypothetical protein